MCLEIQENSDEIWNNLLQLSPSPKYGHKLDLPVEGSLLIKMRKIYKIDVLIVLSA